MSTVIRSEVSKKNPYWIEKYRYFELKYFCRQYPIWKKSADSLLGLQRNKDATDIFVASGVSNPTEKAVIARDEYLRKMELVEKAADELDTGIRSYILKGVCEGVSYDIIRANTAIPYCRETYYTAYRRFFSTLNKLRG